MTLEQAVYFQLPYPQFLLCFSTCQTVYETKELAIKPINSAKNCQLMSVLVNHYSALYSYETVDTSETRRRRLLLSVCQSGTVLLLSPLIAAAAVDRKLAAPGNKPVSAPSAEQLDMIMVVSS
jgi:hypothetical protein